MQRESRIYAPLTGVEVRDSGVGDGSYTIRGHASVFEQPSLPLGWARFTEEVARGAFSNVLATDPHVIANWLHDDRWQLGSTLNETLELREDAVGLYFWVRVAPTSYASDLRVLLERGDVTQCSFCFTIERETWSSVEHVEGDDSEIEIKSLIEEVGELFDVTVCPMGAYPQTDLVFSNKRSRVDDAIKEGRIPGLTLDQARDSGFAEEPEAAPELPAAEGDARTSTDAGHEEQRKRTAAAAKAYAESARAQYPKG